MEKTIEEVSALWTLDRITIPELSEFACWALMHDYDGPALRELAAAMVFDKRRAIESFRVEWAPVVDQALEELAAPRFSWAEAAMLLSRGVARRILSGATEPYCGAREIWNSFYWDLRKESDSSNELSDFIYWASEYEDSDCDERITTCRRAIIEASRRLLGYEPRDDWALRDLPKREDTKK